VLLGPRRIVAAQLGTRPLRVEVRCFCGTVVDSRNPLPPTLTVLAPTSPADRVA
jgi:hypothetical protein